MRRIFSFLAVLFFTLCAQAATVDCEQAREIAARFFDAKGLKVTSEPAKVKGREAERQHAPFYVFNAEDGKGFVVVAGDDRVPAILGFSTRGSFAEGNMPPALRALLDVYSLSPTKVVQKNVAEWTPVEPLVKTQWGQGEPYNKFCPNLGQRALTGCTATAMAQIINYTQWPEETSSVEGYVTTTLSLTMRELPAYRFPWENMNEDEIARLMLYCGQSVKMDYDVDASAAYTAYIPDALKNVFGFSRDTRLIQRGEFENDEQWDKVIYEELAAGRPVLYDAESFRYGGHEFIIDGYEDGLFHVNWGWDGAYDGFFILSNLDPYEETGMEIFHTRMAVIGLHRGSDDPVIVEPDYDIYLTQPLSVGVDLLTRENTLSSFDKFYISSDMKSKHENEETYKVALAIVDGNDEVVEIISEIEREFQPTIYDSEWFEFHSEISPAVAPGKYKVLVFYRKNDSEPWQKCGGADKYYIDLTISDTEADLMTHDPNVEEYGYHTIDGITYRLKNSYNSYCALVYPLDRRYNYKGSLSVPDFVNFDGKVFNVTEMRNDPFTELETLSIGRFRLLVPSCTANLKHLELREGYNDSWGDVNYFQLNGLTELTIPSTSVYATLPIECENLKSVTYNNTRRATNYNVRVNWNWSRLALNDIYFAGGVVPALTENEGVKLDRGITIHVPKGYLDLYKLTVWGEFPLVDDMPELPEEAEIDFGREPDRLDGGLAIGNGTNDVEFAIRLPKEYLEAYKGCKITSIDLKCAGDFEMDDKHYVFITNNAEDYLLKQSYTPLYDNWMRVKLDNPFEITGEDLFIGFGHPHWLSVWPTRSERNVPDSFWFRTMGDDRNGYPPGEWIDFKNNGVLPLTVVIEGEKLPADVSFNSISVSQSGGSSQHSNISPGKSTVKAWIQNHTPKVVKELTFSVSIAGKEVSQHQVPVLLYPNEDKWVEFEIQTERQTDVEGRLLDFQLSVLKINDEPDAVAANSMYRNQFLNIADFYPRNVVMEHTTGTWCPNTPVGLAMIDAMAKKYPENFITIQVHCDEMEPQGNYLQDFPYYGASNVCFLNRAEEIYPEPFDLDDVITQGAAKIEAEATFNGDKVEIQTSVEFAYSEQSSDYRLAFVLLEDNVGPFIQSNDFYGFGWNESEIDKSDYLWWWKTKGQEVEMTYDNVARCIYDSYNGVGGLIPTTIKEGEKYQQHYTVKVSDNVTDTGNLHLAVLLIDHSTGEILNATQTNISGTYDAIHSVDAAPSDHLRYNLQGQRIGDSFKGIVITNGKKVIVK